MGAGQGRAKKVRSDKKKEIQPWIPINLRNCIHRLHIVTKIPVNDIGEEICKSGFRRKHILSYLSKYFKHDIRIDNTIYFGDPNRPSVNIKMPAGFNKPISIRFKKTTLNSILALRTAMECTPAKACALLLEASLDAEFVNDFAENYLKENLDEKELSDLKMIMKYVNQNNPEDDTISWGRMLSYIMDEVREGAEKVQETVSDFIIHNWRK